MSNPPNLCGVFGDDEHPKVVGAQERLLSPCEPDLILIHKVVQNRLMLRLFGEIPSFHHNGAIVLLGADGILHDFYEAGLHLLRPRVFGV